MNKRRISQNQLQLITGISQPTFTKMRKGQSVTVDTLEKIATALNCDIGDIITVKPEKKQEASQAMFSYDAAMLVIQETLKEYMNKHNMSVLEIAKTTSLSVNTIRSCLNGNNISSRSLLKLNQLFIVTNVEKGRQDVGAFKIFGIRRKKNMNTIVVLVSNKC